MTNLFHFSHDPNITIFHPRPVRVPVQRPPGQDWLNGSLVWAIDHDHQAMYLFPRDCPRIICWPTPDTLPEDVATWWQGSTRGKLAYIEQAWLERLSTATLYRYNLPVESFETLQDAGMWVSRKAVKPLNCEQLTELPKLLAQEDTELRVVKSLVPLKRLWKTSLHVSGIRLRKATGGSLVQESK
ncbi:MAG: DUF6886 family protein [Deinococcota bacterium]